MWLSFLQVNIIFPCDSVRWLVRLYLIDHITLPVYCYNECRRSGWLSPILGEMRYTFFRVVYSVCLMLGNATTFYNYNYTAYSYNCYNCSYGLNNLSLPSFCDSCTQLSLLAVGVLSHAHDHSRRHYKSRETRRRDGFHDRHSTCHVVVSSRGFREPTSLRAHELTSNQT